MGKGRLAKTHESQQQSECMYDVHMKGRRGVQGCKAAGGLLNTKTASNLLATASNLLPTASNLLAMASPLLVNCSKAREGLVAKQQNDVRQGSEGKEGSQKRRTRTNSSPVVCMLFGGRRCTLPRHLEIVSFTAYLGIGISTALLLRVETHRVQHHDQAT